MITKVSAINTNYTRLLNVAPLAQHNYAIKPDTVSFNGMSESEKILNNEYKIKTNLPDKEANEFVCDAMLETTRIFEKLFGRKYLPSKVEYTSFTKHHPDWEMASGLYSPSRNSVLINSDMHTFSSYNANKHNTLTTNFWDALKLAIGISPWNSTNHPMSVFVHEFAHCAHFKHLCQKRNSKFWDKGKNTRLSDIEYSTAINGRYGQTDLLEYFAEAMAKEICKYMSADYPEGDGSTYNGPEKLDVTDPIAFIPCDKIGTYYIWEGDMDKIIKNSQKCEESFYHYENDLIFPFPN